MPYLTLKCGNRWQKLPYLHAHNTEKTDCRAEKALQEKFPDLFDFYVILVSLFQTLRHFIHISASFISLSPKLFLFLFLKLWYTVCLQNNKGGGGKHTYTNSRSWNFHEKPLSTMQKLNKVISRLDWLLLCMLIPQLFAFPGTAVNTMKPNKLILTWNVRDHDQDQECIVVKWKIVLVR